jgi:hypothetical protein
MLLSIYILHCNSFEDYDLLLNTKCSFMEFQTWIRYKAVLRIWMLIKYLCYLSINTIQQLWFTHACVDKKWNYTNIVNFDTHFSFRWRSEIQLDLFCFLIGSVLFIHSTIFYLHCKLCFPWIRVRQSKLWHFSDYSIHNPIPIVWSYLFGK